MITAAPTANSRWAFFHSFVPMHRLLTRLIGIFLAFSCFGLQAQKVGVVLSGGGASGIAHVGVLKALEENSIPIDYITGASSGAMVGGLYAAGYSPDEIEKILTSDEYRRVAMGEIDDKFKYYFRDPDPDAHWIAIKLSSDSNFLQTSIPTSFINPAALDFELMHYFDPASAATGYDFDSLFVPFRCVASDIEDKESVVFKDGNMNVAVRASMSYPLYLKPLIVEGKLLFDGGLYNNFPTDIMREQFDPEVIIGSNVSSNEGPPREDDFLSQLRNMVVSKTNYELLGDCCVLIEPKIDLGTFDFTRMQETIDSGYTSTLRQIEEIKEKVHPRIHAKKVQERRMEFRKKLKPLVFDDYEFEGLTAYESNYVERILRRRRDKVLDEEELEKGYYHIYENEKIERLFPYASINENDSTYKLNLQVKKAKNLNIEFGGNLSSRPINTGYIGIGYSSLSTTAMSFKANAYFGKLYTSVLGKARIDLPVRFPIYIEPVVAINRWNYFSSRATFFEDDNSLYLIQNEQYAKLNASFALGNKTKCTLSGGLLTLRDDYYQTQDFAQDDITDKTLLFGRTTSMSIERNSLNHKLYPNKGSFMNLSIRYTDGEESFNPGTTGEQIIIRQPHQWIDAKATLDVYYKSSGTIRLGVYAQGVYSDMRLFSNYTASSLRSPAFRPTPESQTLFLESFRAYQYAAIGHKLIVNLRKNLDLRMEGYIFQPYRFAVNSERTIINELGDPVVEFFPEIRENLERRYTIACLNAVYKSPLGPISAAVNYYYNLPEISGDDINPRTPITFLFHFGYILFNDKALK